MPLSANVREAFHGVKVLGNQEPVVQDDTIVSSCKESLGFHFAVAD